MQNATELIFTCVGLGVAALAWRFVGWMDRSSRASRQPPHVPNRTRPRILALPWQLHAGLGLLLVVVGLYRGDDFAQRGSPLIFGVLLLTAGVISYLRRDR